MKEFLEKQGAEILFSNGYAYRFVYKGKYYSVCDQDERWVGKVWDYTPDITLDEAERAWSNAYSFYTSRRGEGWEEGQKGLEILRKINYYSINVGAGGELGLRMVLWGLGQKDLYQATRPQMGGEESLIGSAILVIAVLFVLGLLSGMFK